MQLARQIGVLDLSLVIEQGFEPDISVEIIPNVKDLNLKGNSLYRFPQAVSLMFRLTRLNAADNFWKTMLSIKIGCSSGLARHLGLYPVNQYLTQ